jgi:ABC-type multidrug transport system fused ATPase/permease subunit
LRKTRVCSILRIQLILVPDWVSSLKRKPETESESRKIGFTKATLQWNTGKQAETKPADKPKDKPLTKIKRAFFGRPQPDAASTEGSDTTAVESTPEPVFQLADLNVDFPTGKLSVVSGPTGSGKTAVLTGLLGEMELIEGHSYLPKQPTQVDPQTGLRNSIAYAAQTPWLQQKSIKDNILFGEEFDEKRYEDTLDACALVPDLDILEDGDQTEIGAKGVSAPSTLVWMDTNDRYLLVVDKKLELLLLVPSTLTPNMSFLMIHSLLLIPIPPNISSTSVFGVHL